jgi:hypothetical protein
MPSPQDYRAYASECLARAERASDPRSREFLRNMAASWLRLAELADRNSQSDLVYETPSPPN